MYVVIRFSEETKEDFIKNIIVIIITIICVFTVACAKPNSADLNLDGPLDYKWNTSINKIEDSFNNKKYSNIKATDKFVSAETRINNFPCNIYVNYFNEDMILGGYSIKNLEDLEKEAFYEIENSYIKFIAKKYGDPQIIEYNDDIGSHHTKWNFKNNCLIEITSFYFSSLNYMSIVYINNKISEEKNNYEKEQREIENKKWLADNKDLIKGKIKTSHDDFNNITWISNVNFITEGGILERLYLYIGKSDEREDYWMRMAINHNYEYDTYKRALYIKKYRFNIDGKIWEFEPRYREVGLDNAYSHRYYENIDINIEGRKDYQMRDLSEMLLAIANSTKTIMRFQGDSRYEDREIPQSEKEAIKIMLSAYEYFNKGGSINDLL